MSRRLPMLDQAPAAINATHGRAMHTDRELAIMGKVPLPSSHSKKENDAPFSRIQQRSGALPNLFRIKRKTSYAPQTSVPCSLQALGVNHSFVPDEYDSVPRNHANTQSYYGGSAQPQFVPSQQNWPHSESHAPYHQPPQYHRPDPVQHSSPPYPGWNLPQQAAPLPRCGSFHQQVQPLPRSATFHAPSPSNPYQAYGSFQTQPIPRCSTFQGSVPSQLPHQQLGSYPAPPPHALAHYSTPHGHPSRVEQYYEPNLPPRSQYYEPAPPAASYHRPSTHPYATAPSHNSPMDRGSVKYKPPLGYPKRSEDRWEHVPRPAQSTAHLISRAEIQEVKGVQTRRNSSAAERPPIDHFKKVNTSRKTPAQCSGAHELSAVEIEALRQFKRRASTPIIMH